jgi:PleD family two-component response regulator
MVADLRAGRSAEDASQGKTSAPGTGEARPRSAHAQRASDPPVIDWRGFHDALRRAALAATQSGAPLSLLLVEPAGRDRDPRPADAARPPIQALAGMIAAEAGAGSALARYAEERLAVIMLETGLGDAIVRAERIGSLCSGGADVLARPAIGVAQFRDDEALGHLIERAEDALDRARSDGALIVVAGHRARSVGRRPSWTPI